MTRRYCLAAALVMFSTAAAPAADPTVEELLTNPKKYNGQTIVLNKVKLFGGINRDREGTALVHVVSAAGKVDFAIGNGPRFKLSPAVAEGLTKATGQGFKPNTPINVVCTVNADEEKPVFIITRMTFFDKKGLIVSRAFGD